MVSTVLAERCPSPLEGLGGESTLADVVARVWEGLAAHELVPCPVCGEQMRPVYGARATGRWSLHQLRDDPELTAPARTLRSVTAARVRDVGRRSQAGPPIISMLMSAG
jgi:hypothetical protein